EREFERHLSPTSVRTGLGLWKFFAKRPRLYHLATAFAMPLMAKLAWRKKRFKTIPLASGWTKHRDMPAPQGRTFQQQWRDRQAGVEGHED
ncbi:MAG: DUF3390 domain-containing protein, partial [Fimbriimonadaceae bacterium]|nr:DUF3390 domain-containing protein [Alphaproteobacteria bacterium]